MPHWEGIEDNSAQPAAVWLARRCRRNNDTTTEHQQTASVSSSTTPKNSATIVDEWKPLRKVDCRALNDASDVSKEYVYIESGRATANLRTNEIQYNFYNGTEREMCSAIWFERDERKSNDIRLIPIQDIADSLRIETLYQKAVNATSSLGDGIQSILSNEVPLGDQTTKIRVQKTGDTLTMRKVPAGWFQNSIILQRGYGEYTVEGEDTEVALGTNVKHLIFVIHGIGEALFSREEVKVSGVVEQIHNARLELNKRQLKEQMQKNQQQQGQSLDSTTTTGRIELIPIEWYSHIHDSSNALMRSLQSTTLSTIPALRAIANDVVFDILMYMTSEFCKSVLETVTKQINDVYNKFKQVHPDFDGTCSLAGHSLGSVICWDLLALLKQSDPKFHNNNNSNNNNNVNYELETSDDDNNADHAYGYQRYVQEENAAISQNGLWGPPLATQHAITQTIPFVPEFVLFFGSPLGLYLTLRGAHPVFDQMRNKDSQVVVSPFTLPAKNIYNIFHPSDPVAYRIEPLLLSPDMKDIPDPAYLTVPGKDLRFHIKAKQLGDVVRKSFIASKSASSNVGKGWSMLLDSAVSMIGDSSSSLIDQKSNNNIKDDNTEVDVNALKFPLGGGSSRVDYSLQTNVIDSEYISAVMAHSCYFSNNDILDFLVSLVKD